MPLIKNNNKKTGMSTIDNYHDKILNNIHSEEKSIPKYEENIKKIKEMLKNENNIEKKLDLKDELNKINKEINLLKKKKKEYLLNNSKYIFEYFEKKKEIGNMNNSKQDMQYFFNNENSKNYDNYENYENNDDNEMINIKNQNITKYFYNISNHIDLNNCFINNYSCQYCKNGELIFNETEGLLICNKCYKTTTYYIENDKPCYKEPPKEVCFYAYKRINHLREILAQFQAKENYTNTT